MKTKKYNLSYLIASIVLSTMFGACSNIKSIFTTGTGLGFFVVLAFFVVLVFFVYKFKKYKKP